MACKVVNAKKKVNIERLCGSSKMLVKEGRG